MQQPARNDRTIETRRLILRPPELGDAGAIAALADNFNVSRNLARVPYPYARADAENWIAGLQEAWNNGAGDFAVFLVDGTFVGVCSYAPEAPPSAGRLGYWYGETFWGRGYATEAARAVISHAYSRSPQATEVNAECHVENRASSRVLAKCGFRVIGRREGWFEARQETVPLLEMKLARTDWEPAETALAPRA